MSIEIRNGFLVLHSVDEVHKVPLAREESFVKGSGITLVRNMGVGTLIQVGSDGWGITVLEDPIDILEAIGRSYTQARAR